MKKLIIACLAAAGLMSLSACTTVNGERGPAPHYTTTSVGPVTSGPTTTPDTDNN
jgi:outer membrane protein assembly factor BamE (lipoprotein component of BamABCDE complex)